MTSPKLTIGMPVYNGAALLPKTLDNLLEQSFQDFQIIISNNGSWDNTAEICDAYAEQDPRIQVYHIQVYHQEKTTNPTENFRFVLDKADTPYFMWSAHDDTRDTDFIEKLVAKLEDESNAILAFGDVLQYIDEKQVPLELDFVNNDRSDFYKLYWSATKPLHHLYGVWRTTSLQSIKWEHTNWWHDTPLMMAASLAGDFAHVPGVKLHYLCNQHHFFDKGLAPKQIIQKTYDLLHLIYQSAKTVGKLHGPINGLKAGVCTIAKISQQIVNFIKNRL